MTETIQLKIRRATFLLYGTTALAAAQSILLHFRTTDFAHEIISPYFAIEILLLGAILFLRLKRRWARIVVAILTIWETFLFLRDTPISPDELLMMIIWAVRVYILTVLFSGAMNRYYREAS